MFKLLRFLKGYKIQTILGPLFKLIEAVLELFIPLLVSMIIDDAIPLGKNGDYSLLIQYSLTMLILAAVGFGFSIVAQFFAARASLGFGTNLRRGLYSHINNLSPEETDRIGAPSLLTRLINDSIQAQQGVAMFIRLVTRVPFITIGSIVMAMLIDIKLSLIIIICAILISIILYFVTTKNFRSYIDARKKLDDISLSTRENLSGMRVVRAFSREEKELEDFNAKNERLSSMQIKIGKLSNILNPLTLLLVNTAIILIIWFGGKQVYYNNLTQGQIIALVNYLTQISHALIIFANLVVTFARSSASAKRINEVFDAPLSRPQGKGAKPLLGKDAVLFNNVSFSYSGNQKNTLENISFSLKKGETMGIVGGTGSGKTTLISLLIGLYDCTQGQIEINGCDILDYTFFDKNQTFGVAMQRSVLFSGTIRDNLKWRKDDASDEEIITALKISQAYDFVFSKKEGLDFVINEGGKNLSGGQKQRLNIARAILGNPDILILDDSSSALDYATDANLRKALKNDLSNITKIIISQRATSMESMDKILVLDDGKIVGNSTHKELLKTCDVYKEIYNSQVDKEEQV